MQLSEVTRILKTHQKELSSLGVKSLSIFGSVARGEETSASDVDLLIELARPMGLFGFVRIKNHLESLLGITVDLVTPDALGPELKARILHEAVRAA